MLSLWTSRASESRGKQLSLDFVSSQTGVAGSRERVSDRVHVLTSHNHSVTYHEDVNKITENTFILKVSYMGRSYSLNGAYRKDRIRSFDQEDFSATAIHIVHSSIFAFQGGRYVATFVSKKDYDALMESAHTILSDSLRYGTVH